MTNSHDEARRLLDAGFKLCVLYPMSKQPVGDEWNRRLLDHPSQVNESAGGFGMMLAVNGLCSVDFDNAPVAERGLLACGFDPAVIRAVGVPTSSTRPGSGGRVTFRVPAGSRLTWVCFRNKTDGTILELRASSPNLQDCLPGTTYLSADGSGPWVQDYSGPFGMDMADDLPADLLAWWQRMSEDLEFLHSQQLLIAGPNAHLDVSSGNTLAFSSPYRIGFNESHSVVDLLEAHGYTENRGRYAPPTASGTHGVRPIPGRDDLWQSDHASDPLQGTFDAWTAFVTLGHGQNLTAAEAEAETHRQHAACEGFTEVDLCADLLTDLRTMEPARIALEWAPRAAQLTETESRAVLEEVHRRTGQGLRVLGGQLKEARQHHAAVLLQSNACGRRTIRHRPEMSATQAQELAGLIRARDPLGLVRHAGRAVRIASVAPLYSHGAAGDEAPEQVLVSEHSRPTLVAAAESVALFTVPGKGGPRLTGIPNPVIDHLITCDAGMVPDISGVVSWPLVTGAGEILTTNGLHEGTGLVVHGCPPGAALKPYTLAEAAAALAWLRQHYLDGFEFASPLDADTALAGLFTAVQRPVLDMAPALAILAAAQSSGKTTLARRQHLVLTGRDAPLSNLPLGNDEELEKRLLALLLTAPPMIVFDNVPDGMALSLGPLNAMLTAPVLEGRILGATKTVRASTASAVVITGNNLRLGADETSRTLITRLAPAAIRPEARQFAHADVVSHAQGIRWQVLAHVVGIVAGHLRSGATCPTRTRFARWDVAVRQSLLWAGGCDVAEVFERNADNAEHLGALRCLLRCLHTEFKAERFSVRDVISRLIFSSPDLTDALEALKCREPQKSRSLGRVLAAQTDRPALVDGHPLKLSAAKDRDGLAVYRVVSG